MKRILVFGIACAFAAISVKAASFDWAIADSAVANMNYAFVDSSVVTALQSGMVYDDEGKFNADIIAGLTYDKEGLASALTSEGTINGKGKKNGSIADVPGEVTVIVWSGVPTDGNSFMYATTATEPYAYVKPAVAESVWNPSFSSGTFKASSYEAPGPGPEPVPEPTSLALIALGVAAFGLKRKHA